MKTIYIDSNFRCHTTNPNGTLKKVETDVFDNLCDKAIETMIYVPKGETYKGTVCKDGFIQCTDTKQCEMYQREHEKLLLAEYESALARSVRLSDLDAAYQEGVNAAYDQ